MLTYDNWEEPTITFPEDDPYKGALSVLNGHTAITAINLFMPAVSELRESF